jgi:tetratricopeptide (TPR) repeat protein
LGAGGFAIWRGRRTSMSPEAALLLQKGMDALQSNDALDPEDEGSTAQAIALLTDATRLAPQSEQAWGGLALAYAARRRSAPVEDRPGLEARGRAAAEAALRLDPSEPRSLAALRIMSPVYRNWLDAEQEARRALSKNPKFPILLFVLSDVLGSVGRWREATELSNRLDRKKFLLPGAERKAIINHWSAGDLQAADEAIKAAVERWPKQRQVWRTQVAYLLYSGRASEALLILNDPQVRPLDAVPGMIEAASATARALTGEISRKDAIAANLTHLRTDPGAALAVAQACAAMDDLKTSFDLLDGYYFGEGQWAGLAPPGGDQDRQTSRLFQPPMRGLWKDGRFAALVRRIGLTDYWRRSGSRPDYLST